MSGHARVPAESAGSSRWAVVPAGDQPWGCSCSQGSPGCTQPLPPGQGVRLLVGEGHSCTGLSVSCSLGLGRRRAVQVSWGRWTPSPAWCSPREGSSPQKEERPQPWVVAALRLLRRGFRGLCGLPSPKCSLSHPVYTRPGFLPSALVHAPIRHGPIVPAAWKGGGDTAMQMVL